jgi:aldehyde dehydrogenase (NAD+)
MTPDFDTEALLIGGNWIKPQHSRMLHDPSTGLPLAAIADATAEEVYAAMLAASAALEGPWGRMSATERGRLLTASCRCWQAAQTGAG